MAFFSLGVVCPEVIYPEVNLWGINGMDVVLFRCLSCLPANSIKRETRIYDIYPCCCSRVCVHVEDRWWMRMGLSVQLILTTSHMMSLCHIMFPCLLVERDAGRRCLTALNTSLSHRNVTLVFFITLLTCLISAAVCTTVCTV